MAFCQYCGAQVNDGASFCASCGKPVAQPSAQQNTNQPLSGYVEQNQASSNQADNATRGYVWLSYIGLLALIPLLTAKDSPNCQFHAKQGLNLTIFEAIVMGAIQITTTVSGFIFGSISDVLGTINSVVLAIAAVGVSVIFLIQCIQGIIASVHLQKRELSLANIIKFVK